MISSNIRVPKVSREKLISQSRYKNLCRPFLGTFVHSGPNDRCSFGLPLDDENAVVITCEILLITTSEIRGALKVVTLLVVTDIAPVDFRVQL